MGALAFAAGLLPVCLLLLVARALSKGRVREPPGSLGAR